MDIMLLLASEMPFREVPEIRVGNWLTPCVDPCVRITLVLWYKCITNLNEDIFKSVKLVCLPIHIWRNSKRKRLSDELLIVAYEGQDKFSGKKSPELVQRCNGNSHFPFNC